MDAKAIRYGSLLVYAYYSSLHCLTVRDADPALVVEPDVGVDDVRAEAGVDGGGGPLALEVADDLLPRAAHRRRAVRQAGGRRRRTCK